MNLTIGRYIAKSSPIHNMDGQSKLIGFLSLAILSFLCASLFDFAILYIYFFIIAYLTNIKLTIFLKGIRTVWLLIVMIFIFNSFFTSGYVLLKIGSVVITREGLINSGIYSLRLIAAIFFSTALSYTTKPIEIADSVESIMNRVRVPSNIARQTGLVLSIALRFISILSEESKQIILSQKARGGFRSEKFLRKLYDMTTVIIPLIVLSLRKAEELAVAMEVRGYNPNKPVSRRTVNVNFSGGMFLVMNILIYISILLN
ncbi:MAG: energy-coupling factor transporter transmembrane protein EcfT [Kosmotoga sp.]|nr:MAG: energy-coupling factor transporter transmembrane protein EcfT [Kosmotoga sp.]